MYSRLALNLIVAEDSLELLALLPLFSGAGNIDMCHHDYFMPSSCGTGELNPRLDSLSPQFLLQEGNGCVCSSSSPSHVLWFRLSPVRHCAALALCSWMVGCYQSVLLASAPQSPKR